MAEVWELYSAPLPPPDIGSLDVLCAQNSDTPALLLFLVHGILSSAYTFTPLATHLLSTCPHLAIAALTLRGHGGSSPLPSPFSPSAFVDDVLCGARFVSARFSPPLPLVLCGHSLGGAAVARAAGAAWPGPPLRGIIGFDFVGDAAEPGAQASLLSRVPRAFASLAAAEAWARAASREAGCLTGGGGHAAAVALDLLREGEGVAWRSRAALDAASDPVVLAGWLAGASAAFLAARCPKLLLLASATSLVGDKGLTVAQMQGKMQVKVIAAGGHWMHEELPGAVAAAVAAFFTRCEFFAG